MPAGWDQNIDQAVGASRRLPNGGIGCALTSIWPQQEAIISQANGRFAGIQGSDGLSQKS